MRKQRRTPMKVKRSALLYPSLIGASKVIAGARLLRAALLMALPGLFALRTLAAAFDCGSTGTNGQMYITNSTTLNLPPDGVFNCTTVTVASGATLTFSNNVLNTPVYLLATSDVTINGTIDVSGQCAGTGIPGRGGPGGFSGGCVGSTMTGQDAGGGGCGPGGGKADWSCGVYGTPIALSAQFSSYANTNVYGNSLLIPLIGGSGGGGSSGTRGNSPGGGGGGAVLIASNTKITVNGAANSNGGNGLGGGNAPGGSGGAFRLVAPIVTGNGNIAAQGCNFNIPGIGNTVMSSGRIRIDCNDNQSYRTLNLVTPASRGSRLIVFPTNAPPLDIVEVAGNPIPEGTNNAVLFELLSGASTNQTVKVQAPNFTNDVPIRVVVTPENGPARHCSTPSSSKPPAIRRAPTCRWSSRRQRLPDPRLDEVKRRPQDH